MAKHPLLFSNITVMFMSFLFTLQSIFTPALCGSSETDLQALFAFRDAIVSDPVRALRTWNESAHFCSWRGVVCGRKHGDRVVAINLMSQGLTGPLSPYIGNLSFLRLINLGNNSFTGHIPEEIGRLRLLEYVDFSNNSFRGEIPRNLSQCKNLNYLVLINNKLKGSIIPEIGSLVKLEALGLALNRFTGAIPPWLGNLTSLTKLSLANCNLEGQIPEDIGRLRQLRYLDLGNNSLTGVIPRNLSQCINLYSLTLRNNRLVGKIIPEIGSLVNLQFLDLTQNQLVGSIPPCIGNLTSLTDLLLQGCELEGQIPESLAQLQSLSAIVLDKNRFIGTIPASLFNSSSIVALSVAYNQLQGTIPSDIGYTLPNIRFLALSTNNFSGEIPDSLLNASFIESIVLSSNQFRGLMLRNFGRLANLRYLTVERNNIHGDTSFISSLTNCTNLRGLALAMNLFNGTVPNSIANLSRNLLYFSLGDNNIHGIIPSSVGSLASLAFLFLPNTYLSGPIPSSIGKLVNMQQLVLSSNKFTGVIPPSLGNLSLLANLDLEYNNFSGTVPPSFRNLHSLLTIDLSHNYLNGSLPREVLSLSSIPIYVGLSHNAFTGPIPQEVGLLINLGFLDLSNNQLSGLIPNVMSSCVNLERLHLEGNSLEGEIPIGLSALKGLQDLDLSRNNLSGLIPSFLGDLHLFSLNLSFNKFSGEVPTLGVFQNKSALSIDGNVDLCGGILELGLRSCPTSSHKKRNAAEIWTILLPTCIVGGLFLVAMVSIGVIMHKRRPHRKRITSRQSFDENFTRISYASLLKSTNGFSCANLIGAGRFGSVYKATLEDGKTVVAVKVLNLDVRGASNTFIAECNALKVIRHRNLIKVLSVCVSSDFRGHDFKALVYDYKSNGSLEEWLHHIAEEDGEKKKNLTVIQRLNMANDIASALEYLHFGTDSIIIHGDLKPSNILLDEDMTAHVGDFGLAKVVMSMSKDDVTSNDSSSVVVKGTIGYIAPEYGMGGMVSTQGDAYSFGILLLEMFTGIRPTDEALKEGHLNLHSFVSSALPDNMVDVLDPLIVEEIEVSDDNKAMDSMLSVLKIGVACSNEFPRDRMSMTDAVTELYKIKGVWHSAERRRMKYVKI